MLVLWCTTGISCLTAPGTGRNHSWIVYIDGSPSPVFAGNTSYGAPIVATYAGEGTVRGDVSCMYGVACGSTRGHQVINITGACGATFCCRVCASSTRKQHAQAARASSTRKQQHAQAAHAL